MRTDDFDFGNSKLYVMSEDFISEMLSSKCQEAEVTPSVKFLDTFCPELHASDLPTAVLQDIDLHLECDDDGNFSLPGEAGNSGMLSHSVIGHNVNLRVSFPLPNSRPVENLPGLKCSFCESIFKKQSKLAKHLLENHNIVKNFQCSDCSFGTTSLRLLRRHSLRKHAYDKGEESKIQDDLCGGPSAATSSHNNCPERDEADAKDISVPDSVYLENSFLKKTKSNICLVGEEDKISSGNGMDDLSLTKINKPNSVDSKHIYMCSKCPYTASTKKYLQMHFSNIHDPEREIFKCDQCSYICKQKRTLQIHQKKHKGDNPLKCDVCQKEFFSVSALKRHTVCHLKVSDIVCSFENCGKGFKNSQSLQSHIYKVHKKSRLKVLKEESPQEGQSGKESDKIKKSLFVCSWSGCGKSFRDNFNLKAHMCLHTGEKPIKCPHCVFSCVQRASLTCHMKKMH